MAVTVAVLIVGGGRAGLACARALSFRGVRPLLVERRTFPLDKVCGEGLMPCALPCLRQLGLGELSGHPFCGIDYLHPRLRAGADFAEGPGQVVRRLELSSQLLSPQVDTWENTRLLGLRRVGDWMEAETSRGLVRARLVIGADGIHSKVSQLMGWLGHRWAWPRRWGWRQHLLVPPWNRRVEVHLARGCEAYVSPAGPDRVGVAVLSPKGPRRQHWLEAFPELRERLAGAAPASDLSGHGPLCRFPRRIHKPGVLLLGDAAGYLDACTGEGLSLALQQALWVADHWSPSLGLTQLPGYGAFHRRLTRAYKVLTAGVLLLSSQDRLLRAALELLRQRPALMQQLLSANQGLLDWKRPLLELLVRLPARWLGDLIADTRMAQQIGGAGRQPADPQVTDGPMELTLRV